MLDNKNKIRNIIYEIRGKQVMLDSDLAILYECKNGTKDINKAVKRNIERFPNDFYFQLTNEDYDNLRFHIGTSKVRGGRRYNPYAFTEQGVAMLASVLRTNVASSVSVNIMRAFVEMRKYINNNLLEQKYINKLVMEHEEKISFIEEIFDTFEEKEKLFLKNQEYDAYSMIIDIFNKSKEEIIIIDNYIDKNFLDILSKIDKKVIIVTNKYDNDAYIKYKKQYHNIRLIINNTIHDRFIIIDRKLLYHCGSSFKDIASKTCYISKIESSSILKTLLNEI